MSTTRPCPYCYSQTIPQDHSMCRACMLKLLDTGWATRFKRLLDEYNLAARQQPVAGHTTNGHPHA